MFILMPQQIILFRKKQPSLEASSDQLTKIWAIPKVRVKVEGDI